MAAAVIPVAKAIGTGLATIGGGSAAAGAATAATGAAGIATAASAMKSPKMPDVPKAAPMPQQDQLDAARRRTVQAQRSRSGVQSTILSGGGRETIG